MARPSQKFLQHIPKSFLSLSMAHSKGNRKITGQSYKDAIQVLNNLQSNAELRAEIVANKNENLERKLPDTIKTAEFMGVSMKMLNSLKIIHVAGTKGKGTTCAFTESILRHSGLRTGFFSSPHLIEVRERIKINGKPISPEKFAQYFFTTYENLMSSKGDNFPMPGYFRFLTCMAFYVFYQEKVDVAVIEVGIGGLLDSTNIIPKPSVVGITSLGLEHQPILGYTLEEIAMNKAGIMKEKAPAFTINNHLPHILQLLQEHASIVKCPFHIVPPLEDYPMEINLGVDDGKVSRLNAALAIQLANSFLWQEYPHIFQKSQLVQNNGVTHEIYPFHTTGLQSTNFPGRFQVIEKAHDLRYFLDGAHTPESLSIALDWFKKRSSTKTFQILIFHLTGERLAPDFLKQVAKYDVFDLVIFCPLYIRGDRSKDNWSALLGGQDLVKTCHEHCKIWKEIIGKPNGLVIDSIDGTVEHISQLYANKTEAAVGLETTLHAYNEEQNHRPIDVLITGSLHLVGNFLSILDPASTE